MAFPNGSLGGMASNLLSTDRLFEGGSLLSWRIKIRRILSTLGVYHVIKSEHPMSPHLLRTWTNYGQSLAVCGYERWEKDNAVCRGILLKGLGSPLFDKIKAHHYARRIWDALVDLFYPDKEDILECLSRDTKGESIKTCWGCGVKGHVKKRCITHDARDPTERSWYEF